jgi:predicted tellurium resistance membrane protein TerC
MRAALLSLGFLLTQMQVTLFSIPFLEPIGLDPAIDMRDIILLVGGAYLVIKGIREIIHMLSLHDEQVEHGHPEAKRKMISLFQAIATIMAMDMVFSLDSVITAIGMSEHLLIMILAVILAIIILIIFADPVSNFINNNPEVKILALTFIVAIGTKLVVESLGFEAHVAGTGIEVVDVMLYFAMGFSLLITIFQIIYNRGLAKMHQEIAEHKNSQD